MVDFAGADALKAFPALQLAAGVLVVIVGVFLTLRAARDNKKDAHIAPAGHDPLGLTIHANNIAGQLGTLNELMRQSLHELRDMHDEQIKTNSRLAEMTDRHGREMEQLRQTVERAGPRRRT